MVRNGFFKRARIVENVLGDAIDHPLGGRPFVRFDAADFYHGLILPCQRYNRFLSSRIYEHSCRRSHSTPKTKLPVCANRCDRCERLECRRAVSAGVFDTSRRDELSGGFAFLHARNDGTRACHPGWALPSNAAGYCSVVQPVAFDGDPVLCPDRHIDTIDSPKIRHHIHIIDLGLCNAAANCAGCGILGRDERGGRAGGPLCIAEPPLGDLWTDERRRYVYRYTLYLSS